MIVKLQDLRALVYHEVEHVKHGTNVAVNLPPWLKGVILRRVRLEEQRAQREAQHGRSA